MAATSGVLAVSPDVLQTVDTSSTPTFLGLDAQGGLWDQLGGVGKAGNLAANAAALIMLGASAVDIGKYIMQAAAGCFGDEYNRCNVCNLGKCPRGITTQDPKLYRRIDPDKVAERVVEVFKAADVELKKIFAPLGRSTELPIGMSDALGVGDKDIADRLQISYVC